MLTDAISRSPQECIEVAGVDKVCVFSKWLLMYLEQLIPVYINNSELGEL